jgi:thiol-disulfide isomerase/thioredoxin
VVDTPEEPIRMVSRRQDPGQRRGRRRRLTVFRLGISVVVLAVIVSSVVLALGYSGNSPTVPVLNTPVPPVHLANLVRGAPAISNASLQGGAVVLNFWGSWCPPCQAEMPTLQAAHRELGNRVTFIGIDEDDSRRAATKFLRSVGVTYGNGFDPNGAVGQSFSIPGTPTTFFISKGRELDFTPGEVTKASLSTDIRRFFGVS